MLKPSIEQTNQALDKFIQLGEELKPTVTETDLVERFILTLHQYHRGEPVNLNMWLNGIKSDGTTINATAFQAVKIIDNNNDTLGYVPPILVDPTGILPSEISGMLHDLFYRAENLERTIPGRGTAFIRDTVIDKVRNRDKEVEALRKLWDKLFIKYGLTPVYSDETNLTNGINDSTSLEDGEFDAEYF